MDRTLDIQCAEALGYKVGYRPLNIIIDGEEHDVLVQTKGAWESAELLRGYSTDPATLDEKLAWIKTYDEQFEHLEILEYRDEVVARFWDAYGWMRQGKGLNIHEATARLVVALAKEKQK